MRLVRRYAADAGPGGFTLLEVLVSLILATLVIGGVMGLMSVSLRYAQHVKDKTSLQPVLEAAAQEILVQPQRAMDGKLSLSGFGNAPPVQISVTEVIGSDGNMMTVRSGKLFRVTLHCGKEMLEFSVIIPQEKG
jgi:Tfp pilus assembly protein PilV